MPRFFYKRYKVFIQANCQSRAIKNVFLKLDRLKDKYEILPVEPVQTWKEEDKKEIVTMVRDADIFIHQPVSEKGFGFYASGNLINYLKNDAIVVSFPNLHFEGYHPQAMNLKDLLGAKIIPPFSLHDRNIIEAYKSGKPLEEVRHIFFDENYYSIEQMKSIVNESLDKLREKEKFTTIKISPIIQGNMMKKKLFHTFNHPTNELIFSLVDKILEELDEEPLTHYEMQSFSSEMLGEIRLPVYKSVQKFFTIGEKIKIVFFQKELIVEEMISEYYTSYKALNFLNQKTIMASTAFYGKLSELAKEELSDQQRVEIAKKMYLVNNIKDIQLAEEAGYGYPMIAKAMTAELLQADLPKSLIIKTKEGTEVRVQTGFTGLEIKKFCELGKL